MARAGLSSRNFNQSQYASSLSLGVGALVARSTADSNISDHSSKSSIPDLNSAIPMFEVLFGPLGLATATAACSSSDMIKRGGYGTKGLTGGAERVFWFTRQPEGRVR